VSLGLSKPIFIPAQAGRYSQLIKKFKASLSDFRCSLCGFDSEEIFWEMGRAFVEAHHGVPLAQQSALIDSPDLRVLAGCCQA
jgi:predicted HNH restriction endonuclease